MSLTAKQLAIIEAQLDEEQVQIKRYTHYARLASDPQLKSRFEHNVLYCQYKRLILQAKDRTDIYGI